MRILRKLYIASLGEKERHEVLTEAVKKLFNTIQEEDILRLNERGKHTYMGRELMEEELTALKNEAEALKNSQLFKILDKEVRYQANYKMFADSQSTEDVISAKLIMWTWDVIKSKLNKL